MKKDKIKFEEKILNNAILLLCSDIMRTEIKKLKDKYNIPKEGLNEENLGNFKENDIMACCAEIYDLCLKYNLPEPYATPFMTLIVYSKLPEKIFKNLNRPIEFMIEENGAGKKYLGILIYPETTIADIQDNWSAIEKERTKIYGYDVSRQRKRKSLYRDVQIRNMLEGGADPKMLARTINNVFKTKQALGYDNLYKITSKLRKDGNKLFDKITKNK